MACVAGALALGACADIFGIHEGTTDGGLADGDVFDGGIDDATPDYVVHDAFSVDVNTALCDASIPLVADNLAMWISQRTGADTKSCGTRIAPCATLNHALPIALANDAGIKTIYLDNSDFVEDINLGSGYAGYTIQGGWIIDDAGVWTQSCNTSLAKIIGPDDAGPATVYIHSVSTTGLTLRLLEVHSKAQGVNGTGESLYAVTVDNSDVLLDNVTLITQNAGQGGFGGVGDAGLGCSPLGGDTGGNGSVGIPGAPGTFAAAPSAYTPATAGAGTPGLHGTVAAGLNGTCNTNCVQSCQ